MPSWSWSAIGRLLHRTSTSPAAAPTSSCGSRRAPPRSSGRSHSSTWPLQVPPGRAPRSWRRRCRGTTPTTAMTTTAGEQPRPRAGGARSAAAAQARAAALRAPPPAVDEPQDRAHALVDQVDAERAQQQSEHGVAVHQHERRPPPRTRARAARATRCARGSRASQRRGRAERLAERQRPDQGRRGRRHHRARSRRGSRPRCEGRRGRRPRPRRAAACSSGPSGRGRPRSSA